MEELVITYGLYYLGFATVLFLLFRRYMFAIFDPMIFIILMLASCLALSVDSYFFIYVLLSITCFFTGFLISGVPRRNYTPITVITNIAFLEIFTVSFFLFYIFVNIMLYKDAGIPLFSENTTESKIAIFSEGTGWMRRVIFFSNFLPVSIILLMLTTKKRMFYASLLILYLGISVLLGSKGGFLGVFFILWFYYTQKNLWNNKNGKIRRLIQSKSKYLIIGSLVIFSFIVAKEAVLEGENFIYSVGFRLMEFGDAMLYYKTEIVRDYFSNYGFTDFLLNEFNGILGMLRIVPYTEPLGYQMVKAYWGEAGEVITGPNGLFIVRGHIFFGYVGGLIYSLLMGYIYSFVRKKILEIKVQNLTLFAFGVFTLFNMDGMVREFSQFISTFFDFFVYTSPLIVFTIAVNQARQSPEKKIALSELSQKPFKDT